MITRLYNYLKKKDEDLAFGLALGLVFGLVFGLASGLASGLVFGLASGLVFGLASGLASGLALGLASGLASGLALGLAFGLASGLASGLANLSQLIPLTPFWIIFSTVVVFLLMELMIILGVKKKKPSTAYVLGRKALALLEALIIYVNTLNLIWIIRNVTKYFPVILKWIGYIGIGLICLGIVSLIVYLLVILNKKIITGEGK